MTETQQEMRERHKTEIAALKATQDAEERALIFVQADADAGKAETTAAIAANRKTSAFGIVAGFETLDSKYVTLTIPTKTGTDAALWSLISAALSDCIVVDDNTVRTKRSVVSNVLAQIESALP